MTVEVPGHLAPDKNSDIHCLIENTPASSDKNIYSHEER